MRHAPARAYWLRRRRLTVPELPEVETIRRGIAPWLEGQRVAALEVRDPRLRFGVDPALPGRVRDQQICMVGRRSKYLLIALERNQTLLIHLGMSGRLHVMPDQSDIPAPGRHDHFDLRTHAGSLLRYHDPRRFGCLQLIEGPPEDSRWLRSLGPEPLEDAFDGDYLHARLRGRSACIKALLMDARIVVGVGNIYAQEALFAAGIRPGRAAGRLSRPDCHRLVAAVRATLAQAVAAGGTTLRDFSGADGNPGYFQQDLQVYGRGGSPCRCCGEALRSTRITGRSCAWCARCQPR